MSRDRLAALTGVGFIVLLIVGGIVAGQPPDAGDSVQDIANYYRDNKDSIEIGSFIGVAAVLLLIWFGAYLRHVLSTAGSGPVLSALPLVGTAIVAVGFAIDATISISIAEAVDDIEPASVQTLQALWDNDFVPLALGALLFLISSGLSIVLYGGLPKWLGWVALALAVIGFTPAGFAAFIGAGIWILVVSVLLAMRAAPSTSAP